MNGKAGRERAQVTFTIAATRTHITCTARLSVRLSIRVSAKLTRCIPVFIARFGRNAMTGTYQCDVYRADASTRRTATRARNIETRKWFHHVAHRRVQTASGHVAKHGSASARRSIFPFFFLQFATDLDVSLDWRFYCAFPLRILRMCDRDRINFSHNRWLRLSSFNFAQSAVLSNYTVHIRKWEKWMTKDA